MYIIPRYRADEMLVYLRKSRTDDPLLTVEEVLARHEQMIDEWVEKNQPDAGRIEEENRYRDVGSGETIESRPRFQELLRRIESPKVKAVLVKDPSRLSRGDLEDIGYLVKILRYTNTIVITLDRGAYDLNDERDRDDFKRELMKGNDYLEYAKKIMQAGTLQSVKTGAYVGSLPPYGYRKVDYKEGSRVIHTLEPIPEEAEVVKRVFEMYSQGLGTCLIAQTLTREHVPAPKGGQWSKASIPRMLDNVHYLGKIKWNRRPNVRTIEDGKVVIKRPEASEYLIVEGKHPAIIDQELWDRVQAIRGSIPRSKKGSTLVNPLAGLMFCAKCGRAMSWRPYKHCGPRYLCTSLPNCGCASGPVDEVLAEVVKVLLQTVEDIAFKIEHGPDDSIERHRQTVARLEKKLADLKSLELKQWDEKIKGEIPSHIFETLNSKTREEIEEVGHELVLLRDAVPEATDWPERHATVHEAIRLITDPEAPVREKNRLLKACIERIDYYREPKEGNARWGETKPLQLHFTLKI